MQNNKRNSSIPGNHTAQIMLQLLNLGIFRYAMNKQQRKIVLSDSSIG